MKKIPATIFVLCGLLAVASCDNKQPAEQASEESRTPSNPQGENVASANQTFLTDNLKKPGWQASASGLQFQVPATRAPESAGQPNASSIVTVHYEGRLIDGTVFDSSYARNEPATFPLGNVISGWQEAVPMMRVGETWEFAIPANLAYGDRSPPPIPPGSTLLFKIELLRLES